MFTHKRAEQVGSGVQPQPSEQCVVLTMQRIPAQITEIQRHFTPMQPQ